MQLTPNYNLKKPEGTDQVDIQDFNDNADIMDAELKKKADSTGGDVSNMTIKTLEEPTGTQFPSTRGRGIIQNVFWKSQEIYE